MGFELGAGSLGLCSGEMPPNALHWIGLWHSPTTSLIGSLTINLVENRGQVDSTALKLVRHRAEVGIPHLIVQVFPTNLIRRDGYLPDHTELSEPFCC